jgi:hypothetical protein
VPPDPAAPRWADRLLPHDQAGVDLLELKVRVHRVEPIGVRLQVHHEPVYRLQGNISAAHTNGGERGNRVFGQVNVVEADDRKVFRDLESCLEERMLHADRGHIVGAQDGRRPVGQSENLLHGVAASVQRVIALHEPIRIALQTDAAHTVDERGLSGGGGAKPKRPGNESDPAMAQNGKVLHGLVDAGPIVHREKAAERPRRSCVDEHDRDVLRREPFEQKVLDAKRHHGYAVDLALEHAASTDLHLLAFVVGAGDENLVAAFHGDLLELLDEFGEERIGDLGDNHAQQPAAAGD